MKIEEVIHSCKIMKSESRLCVVPSVVVFTFNDFSIVSKMSARLRVGRYMVYWYMKCEMKDNSVCI